MRVGVPETDPARALNARAFGRSFGGYRKVARVRGGRLSNAAGYPALVATASLCALAAAALPAAGFWDPALRAMLETGTALAALTAAIWLWSQFRETRHRRDLMLLCGVVVLGTVDLISQAGPVLLQSATAGVVGAAPALATLIAAACFASAAHQASKRPLEPGRHWARLGCGAAAAAAACAELVSVLRGGPIVSMRPDGASALTPSITHPAALPVLAGGILLMALASVRFAADLDAPPGAAIFAFATLLLAVDLLPQVAPVQAAPGAVSLEAPIRLTAFVLLALGALQSRRSRRGDAALAIATRERRRIAQDLHDGLCQDLAFIASQSAWLAGEIAGPNAGDHPLAVAARHALDASRGVLRDLSATDAPDMRVALRRVADELGLRFGITVDVRAGALELSPQTREGIVRIVREAIVNASKHGAASTVTVRLDREDDGGLILRVEDDGRGMTAARRSRDGFGMRSMRERATMLGGHLDVRERTPSGTELKVLIP